jgi:hypothetical protein
MMTAPTAPVTATPVVSLIYVTTGLWITRGSV